MRTLFLAALLAASGCTLLAPENELRVTEYKGEGSYLGQATGAADGCRVVRTQDVQGCLRYHGEKCEYSSAGCDTPTD